MSTPEFDSRKTVEVNGGIESVRNQIMGTAGGQVVQAGSVEEVHFHAVDRFSGRTDHDPLVPAQLPLRLRRFVGRDGELDALRGLRADSPDSPLLVVLSGPGGVGKTTLAVRWLQEMSGDFPGGSLYAELGGVNPEPASPGRTLGWFLESLGVPGQRIPAEPEHRAALFRSMTARSRLVVCLDNAASAAQVRVLLPSGSANVVVVTSRPRMTGLALDGAAFLDVEPLPEDDGLSVLEGFIGRERVAGEVEASRRLVRLCGGLPLAVSIVGARLAARPRRKLRDEARDLVDDQQRLALRVPGEEPVGAVFNASYAGLGPQAQRIYRVCSGHPGREFGVAVVAAAVRWSEADTVMVLTELVEASLLMETGDERYAFHDLVRAHARERAEAEDGVDVAVEATRRMVSWYVTRAVAADLVVHPLRTHVGPLYDVGAPQTGIFENERVAMSWFERERGNLLAVVDHAYSREWDDEAWQMCEALWGYFLRTRRYGDWIAIQSTGIASAVRCRNRRAEARLRSQLGFAYSKVGRFDDAIAENTRALWIGDEIGDQQARATALSQLGRATRGKGDLAGALAYHRRAQQACEGMGRRRGVALNRRRIGNILMEMGELDAAVAELQMAAEAMAELRDRIQHSRCLQFLGAAYQLAGRHDLAMATLGEALAAVSDAESPYYQAEVLAQLGEVAERHGDRAGAADAYHRAAALYEVVEDPKAAVMRSRSASLTET
ncbi:tetratricopeptide repeat protein [Amycolatopsis sp. WAC 01375]|uniref:ATP-binding protein n=1 Tax=Amycolatopsis sp. WAC 01375 TaxID=2203194 RepID=UPI000F76D9DA|nr:tetratricopeptide repeat protein [Amycolatopsis sp. WAC 01375]